MFSLTRPDCNTSFPLKLFTLPLYISGGYARIVHAIVNPVMRRRRCLNKPKRTPTNGKYQAKEPQSQITQEFQTRCVHTFLFVLPRPVGVQCGVWCGYFMWRYNTIRHVYMFFFFILFHLAVGYAMCIFNFMEVGWR